MVAFLVYAGLVIASTLLEVALRRPAKNPRNRANIDEFDVPTIEQGRALPRIHGTVRIDSPSVAWFGDLQSREIRDEGYPAGWRYYMGVQLVFCAGPGVELVEFLYDGKSRPFTAANFPDFKYLTIDMKGTRETKGTPTVEAAFAYFYAGDPNQQANGYLQAKMPGPVPGYPGICYLVLGGGPGNAVPFYVGDSTTARLAGAVLRQVTNRLGVPDGKHQIGGARNPACILYDELTDPKIPYGGAGFDPAEIDVPGLLDIAQTLHAEGMVLSFFFQGRSVEDRIQEVLRHIDAVWFRDPATGLETFRLIRQGYPAPRVYGPGSLREFKRTPVTAGEQPTSVRVSFTDAAAGFQQTPVQINNDAAIEIRGGDVEVTEFDARGATTAAVAMSIAARYSAAVTNPLMAVSGYLDRSAWALRPGDVIQVDWPADGFSGLKVRISTVRLPAPASNPAGDIYFEGLEDQFGIDTVAYAEPPPSGWVPPSGPGALTALRIVAAPPRLFGVDRTTSIHGALVLASRGSGSQNGFNALVLDDDGVYRQAAESGAFCPRGLLVEDITLRSDRILVSAPLDADLLRRVTLGETVAGGSVLLIADELISYRSIRDIGDGTIEVHGLARGVVDTFPAAHIAGSAVLFISAGRTLIELPGPVGSETSRTSTIKAQPFNPAGVLDIASCPTGTVTVGQTPRSRLPGPPTRVIVKGQIYPESINGALNLIWSHRNRLAVSSFQESNATFTAEPGTTYTVEVYGQAGTLIRRVTGLVDNFWEYSVVQELADSGLLSPNTQLRVRLWAVRDGAASWQAYDWTFARVWP